MTALSDSRFVDRIRSRVGKTIHTYGLVRPEDKILLAVSGGKDSMALLEILAWRKQYLMVPDALYAAHVNVEEVPYETDTDYLTTFCESHGIPLFIRAIHIDLQRDPAKQTCFLCSWYRRKELFLLAQELGCNKIAFGHHLDDMIETLLMNMIFHGTFCSMPPKLDMFDGKIALIRPFAAITGNELARYASIRGYHQQKTVCPFENQSQRKEVRKIIQEMTHLNKKVKQNLYRSMSHIEADYLPK